MAYKQKFSFFLILLLTLSISSCMEELDDETPGTNQTNYEGIWLCQENSQLYGKYTYLATISKDTLNTNKIHISNMYHLGDDESAYALISGAALTLPSQIVCPTNAQTLNGKGTLTTSNTIHLSYTINDGADIDSVTTTMTFQKK